MQCPKCSGEAADFNTSDGVVVNFCRVCHGIWFDRGELALYCETEHDLPDLDLLLNQARLTPYLCPRCERTQLVEVPYMTGEDVLIDWCPQCRGAWLDAGEITKVEALAARHELHAVRLQRGIRQLEAAGFGVVGVVTRDKKRRLVS